MYQQRCHTSSVVRFSSACVGLFFHRLFLPLLLHDWPEKNTFAACRGERRSLSHSPASKNPFLRRERRSMITDYPSSGLQCKRPARAVVTDPNLPVLFHP